MSIFSSLAAAVAALLYTRRCPACGGEMIPEERFVCTACRLRIPTTDFASAESNVMAQRFWGLVPVERATALFWFVEGSMWRRMVHRFKYGGHWLLARRFGEWLGSELRHNGGFAGVDVVVPVPLHWRKRLARGYNQSEYVAEGVAAELGVECDFRSVRRVRNNPSQTGQPRHGRWENVEGIFRVRRPERLRGRHVLIVDDVFTTGATICSCAEAILAACGGDVRISVATVAIARTVDEKR